MDANETEICKFVKKLQDPTEQQRPKDVNKIACMQPPGSPSRLRICSGPVCSTIPNMARGAYAIIQGCVIDATLHRRALYCPVLVYGGELSESSGGWWINIDSNS